MLACNIVDYPMLIPLNNSKTKIPFLEYCYTIGIVSNGDKWNDVMARIELVFIIVGAKASCDALLYTMFTANVHKCPINVLFDWC
jgi:hypothetical protein